MKNILVSGASGIVGYGILRSLKKTDRDLRLIGTSIYDDSAASAFCDIFEKAPNTNESGYIDWLIEIIKKYNVDFIIPGIEIDHYKWTDNASVIKQSGAKILLNTIELIHLCKDKWLFYEYFNQNNSSYVIETSLDTDYDTIVNKFGLPFLLKPRIGFGGRGIVRIDSLEAFLKYKDKIGSVLLVQPIIGNENEEYSTSAFCDGQGGVYASMTLRRKLSREGFTEKAEVITAINDIDTAISDLCRIFKPIGPTNFQFRKHNSMLKLLEINPRISSATSIRTAFGYNESEMAIDFYLEGKKPVQPKIIKGKAVRYTEDLIFYEDRNNI